MFFFSRAPISREQNLQLSQKKLFKQPPKYRSCRIIVCVCGVCFFFFVSGVKLCSVLLFYFEFVEWFFSLSVFYNEWHRRGDTNRPPTRRREEIFLSIGLWCRRHWASRRIGPTTADRPSPLVPIDSLSFSLSLAFQFLLHFFFCRFLFAKSGFINSLVFASCVKSVAGQSQCLFRVRLAYNCQRSVG